MEKLEETYSNPSNLFASNLHFLDLLEHVI